ncbi:hypothetical protein [Chroogloeocystis siderophila]|jgi:hypothetical protein|nr:hypothetical protein [Chroogloeocystis siderophila]
MSKNLGRRVSFRNEDAWLFGGLLPAQILAQEAVAALQQVSNG